MPVFNNQKNCARSARVARKRTASCSAALRAAQQLAARRLTSGETRKVLLAAVQRARVAHAARAGHGDVGVV